MLGLRKRSDYWKERLNLREWSITVQLGTKKEMPDSVGMALWSAEELSAVVKIRRGEKEQEPTLVHELLHILLQGHANYDGVYDVHTERAINRIAAALTTSDTKE